MDDFNFLTGSLWSGKTEQGGQILYGAFNGRSGFTYFRPNRGGLGCKFPISVTAAKKLATIIETMARPATPPNSRTSIVNNDWDREAKKFTVGGTLTVGKDDKNRVFIEINTVRDGSTSPCLLRAPFGVNFPAADLSGDESDQDKIITSVIELVAALREQTAMANLLSTFASKSQRNQGRGSRGDGDNSAPKPSGDDYSF